jgi:hypothetical protein
MLVVYKYRVPRVSAGTVTVPAKRRLQHVGFDGEGDLCVWYLVDTDSEKQAVKLLWAYTGEALSDEYSMGELCEVGSAISKSGIVVHVFSVLR